MEDFHRGLAAARNAVEGVLEGRQRELESVEADDVNSVSESSECGDEEASDEGSGGMEDEEVG